VTGEPSAATDAAAAWDHPSIFEAPLAVRGPYASMASVASLALASEAQARSFPDRARLRAEQAEVEMCVVGEGGSSGRATTMMAGGTEWSATGLRKASLAGLAQRGADFTFRAAPRTLSRLCEMSSTPYLAAHAQLHGAGLLDSSQS
jgi:hypothetical protein